MDNNFDFSSWKNNLVYSKEDFLKIMKKLDFFNKKIIDVSMVGNDYILDKSYFVNHYNNAHELSVYDLKKEVSLDDFNENDTELIHVVTEYPIIFSLEDGSTLELLFTLDGRYGIGVNSIPSNKKSKEGNNVDISKLFESIKGKTIVDYRIKKLNPEDGSYIYINKKRLNGTPISRFELILDDDSRLWFSNDALYIMRDKEFEKIGFFDYIKCIYNYENYFSKVSVNRYSEDERQRIINQKET